MDYQHPILTGWDQWPSDEEEIIFIFCYPSFAQPEVIVDALESDPHIFSDVSVKLHISDVADVSFLTARH